MKIFSLQQPIMLPVIILTILTLSKTNAATSVTYLEPGSSAHVLPEVGSFGYTVERMNIYCFSGHEKDLSLLLQSITLNIEIESDDFNCFSGFSPEDVEQAHQNHKSIFSFNVFSRSKKRVMNLNPFNATCIGLETAEEYKITLKLIRLDLMKLVMLLGGFFVFFFSEKLSKNSVFFYLSGISVGNVASVLVLVWFISKLFPRKPLMYGVLASGWTLVAYFAQILVDNIQPILVTYRKYVALYVLCTSVITFAICYYKGPPKNVRSINLIKWGLQAAGLLSIFFSSELKEATIGIILGSVVLYYFPIGIFGFFRRIWHKRFPPKRRLISKEEFDEQGRIETEKALNELREYVKSPQCKQQWKLVMSLSQPTRFASFVEGDDHVTMDETMNHDEEINDLSDDDDDSDDSMDETIDESIAIDENFRPIDKSKIPKYVNGNNSQRYQSFSRISKVSSSTPNTNGRSPRTPRTRQQPFEISDDE